MAELDRFERTFAAGWRAAYNYARGGVASDSEIGDKLIKSLARTLREGGGIPGLPEMGAVVANGLGVSIHESVAALDCLVRDLHGHRHAMVAADAAKFLLISQEVSAPASDSSKVIEQFAIRTCAAIVEHHFFGNARQHMVTEGKLPDHRAAYDWQRRIEDVNRPAIQRIASQLLGNPRAEGLRAPGRTAPKESTSSLLYQDLLASEAPSSTPSRVSR